MNFNEFKEATEKNVGKVQTIKEVEPANSVSVADILEKKEKPKKAPKHIEAMPAADTFHTEGKATESVNVRLEPSFDGEILATLYPGAKIRIEGEQNGWYAAIYQGRNCFVKKEYIVIIK